MRDGVDRWLKRVEHVLDGIFLQKRRAEESFNRGVEALSRGKGLTLLQNNRFITNSIANRRRIGGIKIGESGEAIGAHLFQVAPLFYRS